MKYYRLYMERQQVSSALHQRLLDLERPAPRKRARPWMRYGALAACCALALGLGVWGLAPPRNAGQIASGADSSGTQGTYGSGETPRNKSGIGAEEPDGEGLMLPNVPYINYQDITQVPSMDFSIALPEGSFDRELTQEQILELFWGPEYDGGQTAAELPWMMFWEGYTLTGRATYNGAGELFWLHLWGEHASGASFMLELSPDRLPPTCVVDPGLETSQVNGVPVTGWSRSFDRNGDGVTDVVCGSEFMAGEMGVRFENVDSPFPGKSGSDPLTAASRFNALFVRQVLAEDGGLYWEGLMTCDDIPAWREETFSTLNQARSEEAFAPYLPEKNISGYGEFYGRLSYQEGTENRLWVRWSRGYDNVEVAVRLPEGGDVCRPVDASNPASYDTRLYEIPWGGSVPEEYRDDFYMPVFRAQDMSLAIVEARGTEKDTGGAACRFGVLHENGVLVEYSCDGLTAQQVWKLVESTLEAGLA